MLVNSPSTLPRRIVASAEHLYITLGYDAPVSLLDAATGETIKFFHTDDDPEDDNGNWIRDTAWSPDGTMVAAAKLNGEILIWDYASGDLVTTLMHGDSSFVNEVEWSPDGSKLAYVSTAERNSSQLYVRWMASGEAVRLTCWLVHFLHFFFVP